VVRARQRLPRDLGNFLSYFPTGDFALEQANKFNIGLELKLWESFELLLESYYQRRNNILQSADEINSTIVGIPSSYINKGVVDSKGFEAGLSYNKSFNDLKVNLTALFSYGANKIVDMVEAPWPTRTCPALVTPWGSHLDLKP